MCTRATLLWFVRIGVPLSAILISAGFFFSVLSPTATEASGAASLIKINIVRWAGDANPPCKFWSATRRVPRARGRARAIESYLAELSRR